jgi:predicted transposase YbfD/YdcC
MSGIELLLIDLSKIEDFRKPRGQRYKLCNLLSIFILAIVAGADDFVAVSTFVKSKHSFLEKHGLIGNNRMPSHDIFRRILMLLDKENYSKLLAAWLRFMISEVSLSDVAPACAQVSKMIHIDGKSLRASRIGNQHTRSGLQIVTAYCSDNSVSIGQQLIDKKSCEKTAIPQLIEVLDLQSSVVTIDAIVTTKATVQLLARKKADYVLALKKNNKNLFLEVENFFEHFADTALITDIFSVEENSHGRKEKRTCSILSDLKHFPDVQGWENLKSLICVEATRELHGKISVEKRYYLSSLSANAKILANCIRKHWSIENELHWSLDVAFNEDQCRIRDKNAAANFAATRRFALGLLKNANLSKVGIKNQRLQAAWDDNFLEKLFLFLKKIIL